MKKSFMPRYATAFVFVMVLAVGFVSASFAAAMSDADFVELCRSGTPGQIQAALKAGANANARSSNYDAWTPLTRAASENENPEVISILVKAGADVKWHGGTPLLLAARDNKNPAVISALLEAGADVNAKFESNRTVLMFAALYNDNPEVFPVLIEAGADVGAKDEDGWTALMYAVGNRNPESIYLLTEEDPDDDLRIEDFIRGGNPAVVTLLLKAGADAGARDNEGFTALMYAAMYNKDPGVFSALINAGADVNARSDYGRTALMHAVASKNVGAVSALVASGADVNVKDNDGETVLNLARENGNAEVVSILEKAGAK
jgi:ankyrin repeat protein